MDDNSVNDFALQPEIYHWGNRLVKIYTPFVTINDAVVFWIFCLDDKNITVAAADELELANKCVQILFGGNR